MDGHIDKYHTDDNKDTQRTRCFSTLRRNLVVTPLPAEAMDTGAQSALSRGEWIPATRHARSGSAANNNK